MAKNHATTCCATSRNALRALGKKLNEQQLAREREEDAKRVQESREQQWEYDRLLKEAHEDMIKNMREKNL